MATLKDMRATIEGMFYSDLLTSEAKEDFLQEHPDKENIFDKAWDKLCEKTAKEIINV